MMDSLPSCIPYVAPLVYSRNCTANIVTSLSNRLLRKVPVISAPITRIQAMVDHFLYMNNFGVVEPYDIEKVLQVSTYTLDEKQMYRDAYRGLVELSTHDTAYTIFTKAETYQQEKAPRQICAPAPAYKMLQSVHFKAAEEVIYTPDLITSSGIPPLVKHMTMRQRQQAVSKLSNSTYVYSLDQSAFEAHIQPQFMWNCECRIYLSLFPTPLMYFICQNLVGTQFLRSRKGVHAWKNGGRNSGDCCTALGNFLTSIILLMLVLDDLHATADYLVEGDDVLIASNQPISPQAFLPYGFTTKVVREFDPASASFCGLIFGGAGQVIRDPIRFLLNFGWTFSALGSSAHYKQRLLLGKAICALYETPDCPIVSFWAYYWYLRLQQTSPVFDLDAYHSEMLVEATTGVYRPRAPNPDFDTRGLFAVKFGIPVDLQLLVESRLMCGDVADLALLLPFTGFHFWLWNMFVC